LQAGGATGSTKDFEAETISVWEVFIFFWRGLQCLLRLSLTAGAGDAMSDIYIEIFGVNMLSSISSERAPDSNEDLFPSR
jgi:hypothetical protein